MKLAFVIMKLAVTNVLVVQVQNGLYSFFPKQQCRLESTTSQLQWSCCPSTDTER